MAVIAVRFMLKKAPRWMSCLLWGLVALRLVCPLSVTSAYSLLPSAEVVPGNIAMEQTPQIHSGVRVIDHAVNPVIGDAFAADAAAGGNPMQAVIFAAGIIWSIGVICFLLYALFSYILLKKRVRAAVPVRDGIMACDEVKSPFILGIIHPVIYVPSGLRADTLDLAAAHEKTHLRRHDHWWKPLGFGLLAVYWFHPLCWIAYILLCRDIETACDEKVIRNKDRAYIAAYSQALLDCSIHRRTIAACPLAFGEIGVKERIRGVLRYKKPAFRVILSAAVLCVIVAVCFMTNPQNEPAEARSPEAGNGIIEHKEMGESVSPAANPSASEAEWTEPASPVVNLSASEGADPTEILYADKDRIIFSEYYGLFVYSKERRAITNAVDLEPIGCSRTQGDDFCEKAVSADGNTVYLHPAGSGDMFVYRVRDHSLSREIYDLKGYALHGNPEEINGLDGTVGTVFPATDSCNMFCTGGACYKIGEGSNERFWTLISQFGVYVAEGDMVFAYKKELTGRSPNARYDIKYTVLTNNPDLTFEEVDRSFYSSDSSDWLTGSMVIGMEVMDGANGR